MDGGHQRDGERHGEQAGQAPFFPLVPVFDREAAFQEGIGLIEIFPLFPAMPRDWLWTGTASVNTNTVNPYAYGNVARGGAGESSMTVQQSWAVDMASGEARGDVGRATRLHVQLVRPAP